MTDPKTPATDRPAPALRLRAADADDLAVLSAALQDAIVPVREVAYFPDDRVFALVVNRFMWEAGARHDLAPVASDPDGFGSDEDDDRLAAQRRSGRPLYLRTLSGLAIAGVTKVKSRGVDLRERGRFLNLLAIRLGEGEVRLDFSEDVAIRLEVTALDLRLRDLGEPWPTASCPGHPLDETDAPAQDH